MSRKPITANNRRLENWYMLRIVQIMDTILNTDRADDKYTYTIF
jgi:hypothetical protein